MDATTTVSAQIEANNLKVIKDEIEHELLLNKKFYKYAQCCNDAELKTLCNEASNAHRENFNSLKTYLDSHQ
ncbi:hypothetical protein [Clostridium sp.]|jgi:hypothetical protein|uniref:hypothetical protein n=1 Tax=Clostridium sp. TaxID=1506 RepID=UPI00258D08E5|nr:hypothetical protein [Clostridium sp.]MDF2505014.1 hypothetical protein [Clostridium sp.]